MSVMSWIRGHLCGAKSRHYRAQAQRAVELAEEVTAHANAVNEQLRPIVESDDPITALMMDLHRRHHSNESYKRLVQ